MTNFTLINTYNTNDEKFYIYKHKCGLEVIFVQTKDDNSTFCASFKTPPKNDRGIPHILEHIALCGSKMYPIDDPFNELVKGTLFTYLNAITYADKTIYPVASRNKNEFEKMYKVYLDAVFAPILSKESFLKEGIRKTKNGYSGIVFNEMSSAYNDIENIITYHTNRLLFENTQYMYDSGGKPDEIAKATYEEVKEFYNENYAIDKAILYFYGDLNIEAIFEYLEKNYINKCDFKLDKINLSQFNSDKLIQSHKKQIIKLNKELDIFYYSLAISFERCIDNKFYLDELSILFDFLLESDMSLLTKYLKEKYDLIDISYDFEIETEIPNLSLILKAYEPISNVSLVYDDFIKYCSKICDCGFDKEELLALISLTNFKYIDENFGYKSKGLSYCLDILNYFLYTQDRSYIHLSKNLDFEDLIEKAKKNYFEDLLYECIVLNKNSVFLEIMQDDNILCDSIEDDEYYEYDSILEYSEEYIKPVDLSQLNDFEEIDFERFVYGDKEIFVTKNENEDITFVTLVFKIDTNLDDLGIYLELIGETKTKNYDRRSLKILSDKYIGDLNVSFESILTNGAYDNYLIYEIKLLNKYIVEALDILEEIVNYSNFCDIETNKSKINEMILDFDEELVSDNARLGLIYAFKEINEKFYYKNIVEGFSYYDKLVKHKSENNFIFEHLNDIKNNFIDIKLFLATNEFENNKESIQNFLGKLNINKNIDRKAIEFSQKSNSTNFIDTDSNTYTNIMTGFVKDIEYSGILEVYASIIKNEYLSEKIRIKGGAYGYDIAFDYDMYFYLYSIDDPNFKRTIEIFNNVHKFIKNKDFTDNEINKHIISAVNSFDNFRSYYDKYYLFVLSNLKNIEKGYFISVKRNIICVNRQNLLKISSEIERNTYQKSWLTIGKK